MDERVRQDIRGLTAAPAAPAVAPGGVARPGKRGRWWLWALPGLGAALLLALGYYCRTAMVLDVAEGPGAVCEAHQAPLRTGYVTITYGLVRQTAQEQRDRPRLFPYANERYLGGCEPREPTWARVSYCPKCREALAEWKKASSGP